MKNGTTTEGDSTKLPRGNRDPELDGTHIISSFADGSNPWEAGIKLARQFDDDMCKMLSDELELLLLFAALFSAIVTAFAIMSYPWLQPNNSNSPASPVSPTLAVQINVLWFLSLGASLSVSSVGILCMQWVRQYRGWKEKVDKRTAALRHQRFKGFLDWRVPGIVAALPVLLQIALILFVIGLHLLLWALHHIVAIGFLVSTVPALGFILLTTLSPALQRLGRTSSNWWWSSQCPFQSPQAWVFYSVIAWVRSLWTRKHDSNWEDFDRSWLKEAASTYDSKSVRGGEKASCYENELLCEELVWLDGEYADNIHSIKARAQALQKLPFPDAKLVVIALFRRMKLDEHIHKLDYHLTFDVSDAEKERNLKHLKVWYLWAHAQTHPSLDDGYMEARIDFMSEIPTTKIDLPGLPRAPHLDVEYLVRDEFLIPRFLHCLKVMISYKRMEADTSKEMWSIIGDLLEYSIRHAYTKYFPALSSLFKALLTQLVEFDALPPQNAIIDIHETLTSPRRYHTRPPYNASHTDSTIVDTDAALVSSPQPYVTPPHSPHNPSRMNSTAVPTSTPSSPQSHGLTSSQDAIDSTPMVVVNTTLASTSSSPLASSPPPVGASDLQATSLVQSQEPHPLPPLRRLQPNWELTAIETVQHMLTGLDFFFALHADQKIGHLSKDDATHMQTLLNLLTFLGDKQAYLSATRSPLATSTPGPRGDADPSKESKPRKVWGAVRRKLKLPNPNVVLAQEVLRDVVEEVLQKKAEWNTLVHVLEKWTTPKG